MTARGDRAMGSAGPMVVAIVGPDGCGKSSTYHGLLERLARRMAVMGIGEDVLLGGPHAPLHMASRGPLGCVTARVGGMAHRAHGGRAYQILKLIELAGRARLRDAAVSRASARVLITDGDPLVNSAAWSVAGYYVPELADDDARLLELIDHLSGKARLSLQDLARLPGRAWQLALAERLGLVRFAMPDVIVLLCVDGATAMARISARGRPLQAHESAAFLERLARGYGHVCELLMTHRGATVVDIDAAGLALAGVLDAAEGAVMDALAAHEGAPAAREEAPAAREAAASSQTRDIADPIHPGRHDIVVVATTISGSIQDQRNVGRIGPEFRRRTQRPVRVYEAASHAQARRIAHDAVAGGGRTLVSAGGAGTCSAVLEGCHLDDGVPADLRLAFLRKGSADLIGKALRVPRDLEVGVQAIVDGIESDTTVNADVVAVEAASEDGSWQIRHIMGFGGLGIFGEVPRFTESRLVKLYKGILGSLFGDYGPFFVGLALATLWWFMQRLRGRVPSLALIFDGEETDAATWLAIIVVLADLGPDFPLGRGLAFGSGTFRVVALHYEGLRRSVMQLRACRSGAVLDDPERFGAIVRGVRSFVARPAASLPGPAGGAACAEMVNVDGLRMLTHGAVRFSISGGIRLIPGKPPGA